MANHESPSKFSRESDLISQPQITTYDSGYEHSIEHLSAVRQLLVSETDEVRRGVFARLLKWVQAA